MLSGWFPALGRTEEWQGSIPWDGKGAGPRGLVASEGAQLELEPVPDAPTALSGASLTPPDRPLVGSMCHQRHSRRLLSQRCDDLRWWATP
jgi:hypothetical protein